MIAKLIPYILIYSFIAFQVFNLMYCYKASLPYELIHPISQLLLPLTPQFVLIKLIQSNSLTWVTSFIKKRNNWFIALYMQEQHSLLPLLQNWSCQFTNTILQCIHCIIDIRDASFNLCYHLARHTAFYNCFPYKSGNPKSMKITGINKQNKNFDLQVWTKNEVPFQFVTWRLQYIDWKDERQHEPWIF